MLCGYILNSLNQTSQGYIIDISLIADLGNFTFAMRDTETIIIFIAHIIIKPITSGSSITGDTLQHIPSLFERKWPLCPGCLPGA